MNSEGLPDSDGNVVKFGYKVSDEEFASQFNTAPDPKTSLANNEKLRVALQGELLSTVALSLSCSALPPTFLPFLLHDSRADFAFVNTAIESSSKVVKTEYREYKNHDGEARYEILGESSLLLR